MEKAIMTQRSNDSNNIARIRESWHIIKNTLFLLGLLGSVCCMPLSTAAVIDADIIANYDQPGHHHENVNLIVDDDSTLQHIGLIEKWIDVINEENRQEREQRMRMLRSKLIFEDDDDDIKIDRQREWDMMLEEVDQEFNQRENFEDEDEEEIDEEEDNELEEEEEEEEEAVIESSKNGTSPLTVLHRHDRYRSLQSSGSCVKSAGSLQTAVRGTSPSTATRIPVCTQRMKLGSTARRRGRRLQPTSGFDNGFTTGGGINFSDRWIVLTCRFWRTTKCILDGEGLSRIFYGTNAKLYVVGFQFLNATSNDQVGSGSAMTFLDSSRIQLRNCSFVSNKSRIGGGAILLYKSRLQLIRDNSLTSTIQFVNNQAQYGGAIYSINSTILTTTLPSANDVPITWNGNQASGSGGAIFMMNGTLSLTQTLMIMNEATDGGAGFFDGVRFNGNGITVSENKANRTGGGLIFSNCTVKATNVNVTSNQAESDVGAILFVDSDVFMENLVVVGNLANSTGGILIVSATIGVINGVFDSNEANYDGGALTIVSSNVLFAHPTFLNNIGGSLEESNYSAAVDSIVLENCFASHTELVDAVVNYNDPSIIQTYGNISDWCVGLISDFTTIFLYKFAFNEDISKWDTSRAISMNNMFHNANSFNQDISNWDVSKVIDMGSMFSVAYSFNQNISGWDVSKVTDISFMFYNANSFNQDISKWDISKAISTSHMFDSATSFNQNISTWDVSKVTNMKNMFSYASSFNQDISRWDVSKVTDMSSMFYNAISFNQDISGWNISNVANINSMFDSASAFDQDLCSWNAFCGSLTQTSYAFAGTLCPDTASDPVCGAGPFCHGC